MKQSTTTATAHTVPTSPMNTTTTTTTTTTPMATSSSSSPHLQGIQEYLNEHRLEILYKDMMAALLYYKPKRPLEFMVASLQEIQKKMDQGSLVVNNAEVFRLYAEQNSGRNERNNLGGREQPSPGMDEHGMNGLDEDLPFKGLPAPISFRRRGSVSAESMNPTDEDDQHQRVVIPKTHEARMRIASAIANNLLFRNMESDQKRMIIDAMFERKAKTGEKVIIQGDEGDNFYVVDEGVFEIFVNDKKVVEVGMGGSFGELALMYNTPRAATVVAKVDSVLWAVDRVTFRRIIMNNTFRKRKLYESFLRTVPILASLDNVELVKVADALEPVEFGNDETIIQQGALGDSFYIMVEGEAMVTKIISPNMEAQEVGRLKKGDYFGEIALLTDRPRAATVTALGACKCVSLDTKAFIRLLGPCMDILKRNMENYKKFENHVSA